jgi:hypothetical protein
MIARITSIFDCAEKEFWEKIIEPKSLQYVASPILSFYPIAGDDLGREWITDKTYELKLRFLKIIPLGRHQIKVITISKESNTLVTNESGTLTPVWNHTVQFRQIENRRLRYTDEIEIGAGLLTPAIWVFAHLFYRHRQKRWKTLLKNTHREHRSG